jgi:hypothetical protein
MSSYSKKKKEKNYPETKTKKNTKKKINKNQWNPSAFLFAKHGKHPHPSQQKESSKSINMKIQIRLITYKKIKHLSLLNSD